MGLIDECADKAQFLEEFLISRNENHKIEQRVSNGLGYILRNIGDDLHLISAKMMVGVNKSIAIFKKRRAEDKRKETKAKQINP